MEAAEASTKAKNQSSRLLDIMKLFEDFAPAHDRTIVEVLRRFLLKELDALLEDGRKRIEENQRKVREYDEETARLMAIAPRLVHRDPQEVRVMMIRVEKTNQHGVHAVILEGENLQTFVAHWAREGKGLLLTPNQFEAMIERLREGISSSDDVDYLRQAAGELAYGEFMHMGADFTKTLQVTGG